MDCLNKCENAVLDFYFSVGDHVCALYQCTEELSGQFPLVETVSAFRVLMEIGLLKNCGTAAEAAKLSSAAMGGIKTGYFTQAGDAGEVVKVLQERLVRIELQQAVATDKAAKLEPQGGLAKAPAQTAKK